MEHCRILDKEDVRKKTVEALRRSKETGKEHGFNFCYLNGKVVPTHVEGGEKDSVGIQDDCSKGSKIIGALHIHTKPSSSKDAIPSPTDIQKSIVDNMTFFCIGTNINGRGSTVRCFGKEDLESEIASIIRKDIIKVEDIERSTRAITGRMTVHKDYLDRHSCQRTFT